MLIVGLPGVFLELRYHTNNTKPPSPTPTTANRVHPEIANGVGRAVRDPEFDSIVVPPELIVED